MKCHVSCILRAHKDTDAGPKESPTSFPGSLSLRKAGTGRREPWERGRGKAPSILGDPGADSGCEGKSKRAEKYVTKKKSKERRVESLGTTSYQASSKRSPPSWLLIGARRLLCFSAQSEARTAATVWNWSGKTLSPGALLLLFFVPYFPARLDFPSPPLYKSAPGSPRMAT